MGVWRYFGIKTKTIPDIPMCDCCLSWLATDQTKGTGKIWKCKQHEYVTILHLLEHVLPLVFYQYNIFRSGDLKLYEKVMAQIAIIFICWRRKQYDKSTLSFLSDCAYQRKHLPEYWSKKASILKIITEKKVEVWHSASAAKKH